MLTSVLVGVVVVALNFWVVPSFCFPRKIDEAATAAAAATVAETVAAEIEQRAKSKQIKQVEKKHTHAHRIT